MERTTIHCYEQNMKALWLVVSEKKICFNVFPIVSLWELMTSVARPFYDPRAMVGRIYKEDQYTLLHTKYESSGPCDLSEKNIFFLCFSHDASGLRLVWNPRAPLAGLIKRTTIRCYT